MSPACVFLLVSRDPEVLLRGGLWALTAASVGQDVTVLLCAGPLRAALDADAPLAGARALGLPAFRELLEEARGLGAKVVTCETELRLAAATEDAARAVVDEVVSLASFWRAQAHARLVSL